MCQQRFFRFMARIIPETLTEPELIKVLEVAKKPQTRLAFALGFYQAMRIGEIVNLLPEHVDKGQKLLRIKQGKGSKDRNIPIAPQVMSGLKYLPIKCGIRGLQVAFKKALKRAGITKNLHFHSLRHSGATFYLNIKRWDLRSVQVFLGHSKVTTTEIYTHVNPENLVERMWGTYGNLP